jgi:hypothetical protein
VKKETGGCPKLLDLISELIMFIDLGDITAFIHPGNLVSFVKIFALLLLFRGRDSSVGIATRYGLDGPGI